MQNILIFFSYGHLPCVRKRGGGRGADKTDWTYFPIEMCEVVAHQKVDLKKTDETQSRELIIVSAVKPEQRLLDIKMKVRRFFLFDFFHFLTNFAIHF